MKKLLSIIGIALLVLFVIFGSLYAIDHKRMDNNEHVVFSTWGKDYAPTEITPEEAIDVVKKRLDPNLLRITNFDNPKLKRLCSKLDHRYIFTMRMLILSVESYIKLLFTPNKTVCWDRLLNM